MIRKEKCLKVRDRVLDLVNNSELSEREAVYTLAQIWVDIGCSLEGYDRVPTVDEIKAVYYAEPGRFGNALLLNGLQVQAALADLEFKENKKEPKEK